MKVDIAERKQTQKALERSEVESRQMAHENDVLAEIGRIVGSTLDIDEAYHRLAAEIRILIPFDRISIITIDPDAGGMVYSFVAGTYIPGFCQGDALSPSGVIGSTVTGCRAWTSSERGFRV